MSRQRVQDKELFLNLKVDSQYWTGYDSLLVDGIIKRGLSLCDEADTEITERKRFRLKMLAVVICVMGAIFGISLGVRAEIDKVQFQKGFDEGLKTSIEKSSYVPFKNEEFGTVYVNANLIPKNND